jgi:hypothetical protein
MRYELVLKECPGVHFHLRFRVISSILLTTLTPTPYLCDARVTSNLESGVCMHLCFSLSICMNTKQGVSRLLPSSRVTPFVMADCIC